MVEIDPSLAAIVVATVGIVLWLVTQVHLLRVARRIEANIDAKRSETQDFVDDRIGKLETTVGGFEARMTAQMPPNMDGRLTELQTELKAQLVDIDRGIAAALQSIDTSFHGVMGNMGDAEREMRKSLVGIDEEATSALQEAMTTQDTSNPVVRRLYAWAAKPIDPKLEAKNPIGAAALQLGKAALLERLQSQTIAGATTSFLKRTSEGSKVL